MAYGVDAPAYWAPELEGDELSELTQERCVIIAEHFFLRGVLPVRVHDADDAFEWGVWVSVSEANYRRAIELWDDERREQTPPMFGWLSTDLPVYEPTTINLKTMVHKRAPGLRPVVELEHTDHPLAVEYHQGITVARVAEIAALMHQVDRQHRGGRGRPWRRRARPKS